jgi:hypothetical protein
MWQEPFLLKRDEVERQERTDSDLWLNEGNRVDFGERTEWLRNNPKHWTDSFLWNSWNENDLWEDSGMITFEFSEFFWNSNKSETLSLALICAFVSRKRWDIDKDFDNEQLRNGSLDQTLDDWLCPRFDFINPIGSCGGASQECLRWTFPWKDESILWDPRRTVHSSTLNDDESTKIIRNNRKMSILGHTTCKNRWIKSNRSHMNGPRVDQSGQHSLNFVDCDGNIHEDVSLEESKVLQLNRNCVLRCQWIIIEQEIWSRKEMVKSWWILENYQNNSHRKIQFSFLLSFKTIFCVDWTSKIWFWSLIDWLIDGMIDWILQSMNSSWNSLKTWSTKSGTSHTTKWDWAFHHC